MMKKIMAGLCATSSALIFLGMCITTGFAQQERSTLAAEIESYAKQHDFNGTVLVEQRGTIVYEHSYGMADRAFSVPASNDTRYRVASITKALTATIILELVDEKKLDLGSSIHAYLPLFQGEGADRIQVSNLLNHTSGLPNMDRAKSYEDALRQGLPMYETLQSPEKVVERYCTGQLTHPVGAKFDYNNCDYLLLGQIIEKVTGETYEEALKERLLGPLKMSDSGIRYQSDIVPKLANTYYRPAPGKPLRNDFPLYSENQYAAGAMYSTAEDILRFSDALFGGKLLQPSSLQHMLTPGLDEYGDGLWIRTFVLSGRKRRVIERYGSGMGANALLTVIPDDATTIILLSNTNMTDLSDFRLMIARELIF